MTILQKFFLCQCLIIISFFSLGYLCPTYAQTEENPFLIKAKQNELTIGMLTDGLGSSDTQQRHQAAVAILSIRDHYLAAAKNVLLSDKISNTKNKNTAEALSVLSKLRSSDFESAQLISYFFYFDAENYFQSSDTSPYYPAADAIERMSLPALPILSGIISKAPVPNSATPPAVADVALLRTIAILGPATPQWLQHRSSLTLVPKQRKTLAKDALFLTASVGTRGISSSYGGAFYLVGRNLLEGGYDPEWYDSLSAKDFKIQWNLVEALNYNKAQSPNSSTQTDTDPIDEKVGLVLGFMQYIIVKRLEVVPVGHHSDYAAYPPEAQLDAIRVLGDLRSDYAPWVIWERLCRRSMTVLLDQNNSDDTAACIKALGQIDIPAAKMLREEITTQLATEQQRAATYALGKVMGEYAIPYMQQEVAILQQAALDDKDLHDQYLKQVKIVQSMLELGKEKGWFTGDYYGAHDPHAYDLVFDDAPAPAKTP